MLFRLDISLLGLIKSCMSRKQKKFVQEMFSLKLSALLFKKIASNYDLEVMYYNHGQYIWNMGKKSSKI